MLNLEIGKDDFIDFNCIKRMRKIPKTDIWELYFTGGTALKEVPIRVTSSQLKTLKKPFKNLSIDSLSQL